MAHNNLASSESDSLDDDRETFLSALERLDAMYNDEDMDDDDEDDELDDEYHDAEEPDIDVEIVIEDDDNDDEDDDEDDEDDEEGESEGDNATDQRAGTAERLATLLTTRGGTPFLNQRQLLLLLRGVDLGTVLFHTGDDEDDLRLRRRRQPPDPNRLPKVPSEEGRKLMDSGVFGTNALPSRIGLSPSKHIARRILDRELGIGDKISRQANQNLMAQSLLPSTAADMIVRFEEPVYSGQFSDDGNFFFAASKDFRVRMYDTSNPYNWRHYKTALFPFGQWTLTDASLSPDNKWLAYTSICPHVCLAPTDPNDMGDPYTLDLSNAADAEGNHGRRHHSFGIWSVRFSGDGRELVAGTNSASIIVYDIESRQVLHSIRGHDDDVNAVCFADKLSPHIVYSGSDDTTIKVWDRRSMGDRREAGAFVGHCEGLTYIDSKGDGRYILSNGKDQCMKLWDLRMAMSTTAFAERDPTQHTRRSDFDYRWNDYDEDDWFKHPDDNSLVTFRGHRVQRTLIRCHFSPPASTNSRYVYSGSHDGSVYVWNLDATLATKIDVRQATKKMLHPRYRHHQGSRWSTCVRDASWHPNAPLLAASAWNGANMDFGTCTLHSYNEGDEDEVEPKMGRQVDDKLAPVERSYARSSNRGSVDQLWGELN